MNRGGLLKIASSILLASGVNAVHNILDYGAVPDLEDTVSAFTNADAIAAAIEAAIQPDQTDREVYVPSGYSFTFMPVRLEGLNDLIITVDGTLLACKNYLDYPLNSGGGVPSMFEFRIVNNLKW